jgi:nucleotide-binding universal stress UspA family protein
MDTIVVGVDGSESSLDALRWAVDEGRRRHWAVKAVLAWTQPYVGRVYGRFADPAWLQEQAEQRLDEWLQEELADVTDVVVSREARKGSAAGVLLDAAREADLLVVGSHGHGGFSNLVLGSVSQQCTHHAPCPVVIIPTMD